MTTTRIRAVLLLLLALPLSGCGIAVMTCGLKHGDGSLTDHVCRLF